MQTLIFLFIGWLSVMAQSTFLTPLRLSGVGPDFVLIAVTFYAIHNGALRGAWAGFCMGLLLDIFSAAPLGFHTLLYCLTGTVMGVLAVFFYWRQWRIQALILALATTLQYFFILAGEIFLSGHLRSFHPALSLTGFLWEACVNALLAPLFFMVFLGSEQARQAVSQAVEVFLKEKYLHQLPPLQRYHKRKSGDKGA